jgi:hypothetical protein
LDLRSIWETQRNVAACALLLAATALLYAKALPYGFISSWDDGSYVLENPYIRDLSLANLKAIFSKSFVSAYAPLHIMSYSIDHALWGLRPAGYHFVNILLHGVNACLLYTLIRRLTASDGAALLTGVLFVAHPVNVENVAWVAERKTLLATFFMFLSLLAYITHREGNRRCHYIGALVLALCATLSKSTAVVLPLILLLYEWLLREGDRRWRLTAPFVGIAAIGAALTYFIHIGTDSLEKGALKAEVLFGTVYPTSLTIYWKYVWLLVWPKRLCAFYDATLYHGFLEAPVFLSLLCWGAVTALVWVRGDRQVRFWYLWFWACLLPVSNLIPLSTFYADRFMYTPALGLFTIAALCLVRGATRAKRAMDLRSPLLQPIAMALISLGLLGWFGTLAHQRLDVWSDEVTFWEDTVNKSPKLYKPHLNLGVAYELSGRLPEAAREYALAIRIFPGPRAVENLRMVRLKMRHQRGVEMEHPLHTPADRRAPRPEASRD